MVTQNTTSNVLGPLFVGYVFSLVLLGVMATQVLLYYTQHKRDTMWIKAFVAVIFVLNVLNTTFNFTYLYRTMIIFFGNQDRLLHVSWLLDTEPIITAVILFLIQCFFAWRMYQLTGAWIYTSLVTFLAVTSFVGGILNSANVARVANVNHFENDKTAMFLWLIPGVACIATVFAVHMWYLVNFRMLLLLAITQQNKFSRRDAFFDRVFRVCVQTGFSILIVAFIDLVVYLGSERTSLHLIFNTPLSRTYSATLFCMLNARNGWNFKGLARDNLQILQPGRSYDMKIGPTMQFAAPRVDITVHVD